MQLRSPIATIALLLTVGSARAQSTGETDADPPAPPSTWQRNPYPNQAPPLLPGQAPTGQLPSGQVPGQVLGRYPATPYPGGQYPGGQYPGQYPQPQYPQGQYPTGRNPQPQYPPGASPQPQSPGAYPQPQYPAGAYPQPQYPAGAYPQPQYPAGAYPQPQYPAGAYPQPQYPGGQPPYRAPQAQYPQGAYPPPASYSQYPRGASPPYPQGQVPQYPPGGAAYPNSPSPAAPSPYFRDAWGRPVAPTPNGAARAWPQAPEAAPGQPPAGAMPAPPASFEPLQPAPPQGAPSAPGASLGPSPAATMNQPSAASPRPSLSLGATPSVASPISPSFEGPPAPIPSATPLVNGRGAQPDGARAATAAGAPTIAAKVAPAPALAAHPRLQLSSPNAAARADALACLEALENNHSDVARARCGDAVAKDDGLALAHFWLAQSLWAPEAAGAEVRKALQRVRLASVAEQALVDGWVAWKEGRLGDARLAFDAIVRLAPEGAHGYVVRGQLRQSLGDLEGAVADFTKAVALDDRYGAARNLLGFALAAQGKRDLALESLHRWVELAPGEANAHDSLATLALHTGDLPGALGEARRAVAADSNFLVAHTTLGDALLFLGQAAEARREYALAAASDDPAVRHEAMMRDARSHLFEGHGPDAEHALIVEGAAARKAGRALDSTEAFVEAARVQLDRGALAEAGRGLKEAAGSFAAATPSNPEPPFLDELRRRRVGADLIEARALELSMIYENVLASVKLDELLAQLRAIGDTQADARVGGLRGWMAYRSGDEQAAMVGLERATRPTQRFAYAQLLTQKGDGDKAKVILDELAHRTGNDLETALTRPKSTSTSVTGVAAPARKHLRRRAPR